MNNLEVLGYLTILNRHSKESMSLNKSSKLLNFKSGSDRKFRVISKMFIDEEILEEDGFFEWRGRAIKTYKKNNAKIIPKILTLDNHFGVPWAKEIVNMVKSDRRLWMRWI